MKTSSKVNFVKVGNGRIALYHRPRRKDFSHLRDLGCTHIVTLLRDGEGAQKYGESTRRAGMEWIWLPVPDGKYPEGEVHERLIETLPTLSQLLDDGKSLLIHCSAGIHRTGTVAYGLLRWRGVEKKQAMKIIRKAREATAEGMMDKRMRWGDDNVRQSGQQDHPWIHFIKEFANRLRTNPFK